MPSKNTEPEKPIKKSAKRKTSAAGKKTTTNSGTATKKTTKRTTKSGSGATKSIKKPAANTAEKKAPVLTVSPEERENNIRVAAYYCWEQRGRIHGCDVEDWIQAEQQ